MEPNSEAIQISEHASENLKTNEESAFKLPEEDFVDGSLGITVSK